MMQNPAEFFSGLKDQSGRLVTTTTDVQNDITLNMHLTLPNVKNYDEFAHVLLGENPGRENDRERILAYNIGISLHDIYFASQIYDAIGSSAKELILENETKKFWL